MKFFVGILCGALAWTAFIYLYDAHADKHSDFEFFNKEDDELIKQELSKLS